MLLFTIVKKLIFITIYSDDINDSPKEGRNYSGRTFIHIDGLIDFTFRYRITNFSIQLIQIYQNLGKLFSSYFDLML